MKELKLFLLSGLLIILYIGVNAQQVISSAGISGSNGSGSINSTVGELVIDTKTAGGTTITQGFHQTKLTVTAIKELNGLDFTITASPNPTNDFVVVKTNSTNPTKLGYSIFDMHGKLISNGIFESTLVTIPFGGMQSATYIIKIVQENKEIKTFKIVKQ